MHVDGLDDSADIVDARKSLHKSPVGRNRTHGHAEYTCDNMLAGSEMPIVIAHIVDGRAGAREGQADAARRRAPSPHRRFVGEQKQCY